MEAEKTTLVEETDLPTKIRMYLLSALTKDGAKTIAELTELVATSGSKVEKSEDLGLKRLAFAINKMRELTLVSVFFQADAKVLDALNAEIKHATTIERFILTDWKADLNAPPRRPRPGELPRESAKEPVLEATAEPVVEETTNV